MINLIRKDGYSVRQSCDLRKMKAWHALVGYWAVYGQFRRSTLPPKTVTESMRVAADQAFSNAILLVRFRYVAWLLAVPMLTRGCFVRWYRKYEL